MAANSSLGNRTVITVDIGLGQRRSRPSGVSKRQGSWTPSEIEDCLVLQPANSTAHADARARILFCLSHRARRWLLTLGGWKTRGHVCRELSSDAILD